MSYENSVVATLESTKGNPASGAGIKKAAGRIGCEEAVLKAILEVESGGRAYDPKGRLDLLPEAHIFWKYLPANIRERAQKLGLARPKWNKRVQYKGLGGAGSDARWKRLDNMAVLNEGAALKSCSWGKAQIMGFNHKICGYGSVHEFVMALAESEDNQDEAFIGFLEGNGLADELRDRDFEAIARRYNGPGQVSLYAGRMRREYEKLTNSPAVVANPLRARALRLGSNGYRVKALQERLNELGYHVQVDSDFGPATRRAVVAFQADHGIATDGIVGPQTQEALDKAVPIELDETRSEATANDLKGKSRIVDSTDTVKKVAGSSGAVIGAGGVAEETGLIDKAKELAEEGKEVRTILDTVVDLGAFAAEHWWIVVPVILIAVFIWAHKAQKARVEDHRRGKTV